MWGLCAGLDLRKSFGAHREATARDEALAHGVPRSARDERRPRRSEELRGEARGCLGGRLGRLLLGSLHHHRPAMARSPPSLEMREEKRRAFFWEAEAWSSTPAPWSLAIQNPLCSLQRCQKCCASDLGHTFAQVTVSTLSRLPLRGLFVRYLILDKPSGLRTEDALRASVSTL